MFPKMGIPQNDGFIVENPIQMDDLGVPLFLETPNAFSEENVVEVNVLPRNDLKHMSLNVEMASWDQSIN